MKNDKRAQQLARLEAMHQQAEQRFEEQRQRMHKRFTRAKQRLSTDASDPSDEQQRIITAALELLNESGLNDLSLRKLAGKLNLKAPALYWYFKNKDVLIDYMAEAILKNEFNDLQPRHPNEAWQDWLTITCSRLRNAMRSYRDGARVVAGAHLFPAITLLKIFEVSMQSLTSAGIELQRANLIITTAVHFVFGNVIEEQSSPSLEEMQQDLSKFLENYPLMGESVKRTVQAFLDGHDEFEDAIHLIIGNA